jgi:hypothetical protein
MANKTYRRGRNQRRGRARTQRRARARSQRGGGQFHWQQGPLPFN